VVLVHSAEHNQVASVRWSQAGRPTFHGRPWNTRTKVQWHGWSWRLWCQFCTLCSEKNTH